MDHAALAQDLDLALREAREVGRLSTEHKDFTLSDAYQIQEAGIRLREARGEKRVGLKLGFTSEAKRQQMGLGLPIYGWITDRMRILNGGGVPLKGSIHPKIEPEIAFITSRELRGRVSRDEALAACSGVCAAMEILDSRFVGFKYFSLEDVVADNCSSSMFVLSDDILRPDQIDLSDLEMVMEVNGVVSQSARSHAISGHPAQSLVQLCEMLDGHGLALPAGSIVMAGAATQAVALEPGMKVRARVEKLGEVSVVVDRAPLVP